MYLKNLELHGFKSFPNKTTLNFEKGATVIIGPNGSGKSNISDAMRWVLGEMSTKTIRGSKMEDVIFGGADTRRPMGYAEVSVTFDNTDQEHRIDSDYDEITVTRRYYRSGDSEYFLNRKPCRLRDIHELFLNTGVGREGYSIIGQGRIAEILSKKSEDRRNIFEEAAGISKFRYRKTESEIRLSECENNMIRISDVLGELESRVGPLERDSEKAKKYLELYEEKKRADVSLWIYDTARLHDEQEAAASALKMSEHELEIAEDTLLGFERQYDKLFEESQRAKYESEKLLGEIKQVEELIYKLEAEYKVSQSESVHTETLIGLCENSAQEYQKQKNNAQILAQGLEDEIKSHEEKLLLLEAEYAASCDKQKYYAERLTGYQSQLDSMLSEIRELEDKCTDIKVRISVLENSHQSDISKGEETRGELERYLTQTTALKEKIETTGTALSEYESRMALCEAEAEKIGAEIDEKSKSVENISKQISDASVRRDAAHEKAKTLSDMEAHFEGYANGVRFTMRKYGEEGIDGAGTIYGPLSKLISTRDEYMVAAEIALANNIQSIVCDNEQTAKAAIRLLKHSGQGRVTFYPLTSMHAQDETEEMRRAYKCKGYIGTASQIIDCEDKFRVVLDSVLGRTLVFDTLDNASECAKTVKYRVKLVTLDGQIINAGGSYTGGSSKKDSTIMSRTSQIETLRATEKEMSEIVIRLEDEKETLTGEIDSLRAKESTQKQQYALISAMAAAERAQLEAYKAKLETETELISKLTADITRLDEQSSGYEGELSSLQQKALQYESRAQELREARIAIDIERNEENDEKERELATSNEILIRLAEARKDKEGCTDRLSSQISRIGEIDSDIEANAQKIAVYKEQLSSLSKNRELNTQNSDEFKKQLEELNQKRQGSEADGIDFEKKQNELRAKIREKTAEKEVLFKAHTKNEAKYRSLSEQKDKFTSQIWEDYELTYSAAVALGYPEVTEESRAETAALAHKLKSQIKALGSVNVNAIEEYAEIKARYDDMTRQITDLSASRRQLEGIIARIEGEMKRSFSEAFNRINENFKVTFSELFGGGTAELLLTDPENILTSGIDIKAAPPGKIVKSLTLLSGGEQAFVAIALLFAVLKVNPSPFCILDEIEAALDEVNVARFAEYIKKFDSIQFILITHRRGTMEAADRMYGVTMPEQGVSKVIELNVYEFEKRRDEFIK